MRKAFVLVAAGFAVPLSVWGHHGWSEYDSSRPLRLTGKIIESGYEHPHGHAQLQAQGKTWRVILAPPSRMERRGLQKAALQPGTLVTVEGYPNRGKPEEMRAERISIQDKVVELR